MHIFDIRRSNSVTELWKRFETNHPAQNENDIKTIPKALVHDEVPAADNPTTSPDSRDEPRPFMEVFEAELASMLNAAESSEDKASGPDSPPTAEPSARTNSSRTTHPVEVLAAQVLGQLINGATMVQSEWRSKLPELQRQLQNAQRQFEAAQRSLPVNVEASLRTLLATVEAHLRTAFNNLPDGGRQMAEDAFQAGRPVAENAADGFRMMASEINEVGKTLFAAFESEFGRAGSATSTSSSTSGPSNPEASGPIGDATRRNEPDTSGPVYQNSDTHPSSTSTNEKSTPSQSKPPRMPPGGQFMAACPNYWSPPTWRPPVWNPFQNYNAPPPLHHPHPPTPLPNFPRWPQWAPSPVPPRAPPVQVKSDRPKEVSKIRSLFVGNVGFKVTGKMIQDVFASKGFLVTVDLPLDTVSGRHAGFGYVYFPSEHPAFAAMEALQGAIIDGHSINLEPMDHPPIERVHSENSANSRLVQNPQPQAELNGISPMVSSLSSAPHEKAVNRRKSVSFVDIASNSDSQPQVDSSPLLDSASDDPAFSARFPSLLPETSSQHDDSLSEGNISSCQKAEREIGMSSFPPVSQRDAQLLANQQEHRVTESIMKGLSGPSSTIPDHRETCSPPKHLASEASLAPPHHITTKSRSVDNHPGAEHAASKRATDDTGHRSHHRHAARHTPLKHSASMRHLGHRSHRPAETDTWARLSRRERNGPLSSQQIPGSFSAEDMMQVPSPNSIDHQSNGRIIEECVSALIDMGYGTEQEGGRSRMSVYAAAANGVLMDAIDMIEEERRVYERRASQ